MSLPTSNERIQYVDRLKLTLEDFKALEKGQTILIKALRPKYVRSGDEEDYFFSLIKGIDKTVTYEIYSSWSSSIFTENGDTFIGVVLSTEEEFPQEEDATLISYASYRKRCSQWTGRDKMAAMKVKRAAGAKRRHKDAIKDGCNIRIRRTAQEIVAVMAADARKTIGVFVSELIEAEDRKLKAETNGTQK